MLFLTAALFVPISFSLAAVVQLSERDTCADVHLFLARGNGEDYPGRVGALADSVCSGLPSCDFENIIFTSTEVYCGQVGDGATSGVQQISSYASRCPNSKIVLGGYSLGAQVVGDILGGGGGNFYGCNERTTPALPSSLSSRISVVLMFGDVRHVANQAYNVGPGSSANGQYPRSGGQLGGLNQYSNVMHSWCLATDPICAGGNDGWSHTTYMDVYAGAAGAYAQQLLGFQKAPTTTSAAPTTAGATTTAPQDAPTAAPTSFNVDTTSAFVDVPSSSPVSSSTAAPSATDSSDASDAAASSSSIISSVSASSTSTSTSTSSPVPFVFTDTPTSTTLTAASVSSTFAPMTPTQLPMTTTSSSSTSTKRPASTASVVTTSSKAGAYSNSAQVTINLLTTLVVLKALVF